MLLRNPSDLSKHEIQRWDELGARADVPDPQSCASAWQLTAFACSRRAGAPIVLRQSGNSQIAFVLTSTPDSYQLGPLEAHWHFGSPFLGPDALGLLEAVVEELRPVLQTGNIPITLSGLNPTGSHAAEIKTAFPHRRTYVQDRQAAASLVGGIEGWLARRSPGFRRNLSRAQRRAQSAGIWFERVNPTSPEEADTLYERMLAIEGESWKGPLRQGLLAVSTFYRMLLHAYAERNHARVVFAKHGTEDAGFCFGGASGGIYRGQQTSYRDDLSSLSLGTLMHFETTQWLAEDGVWLQHFGPIQRAMPYKSRFCEIEYPSMQTAFSM